MLKKLNRLTKQKDFEKIFKKGRSVYDSNLGIKVLKNDLSENRYGIIISAKVSKKAVERNRIKRLIREIIKKENINLKNGNDIVIVTFPGIKDLKPEEIAPLLIKNWSKLKLLNVG